MKNTYEIYTYNELHVVGVCFNYLLILWCLKKMKN